MTTQFESTRPAFKEPLHIGRIISDSLNIVNRNIFTFAVLFIPVLIVYAIYFYIVFKHWLIQNSSLMTLQQPNLWPFAYIFLGQIPIYLVAIVCCNAMSLYAYTRQRNQRQTVFSALLSGLLRTPSVFAIGLVLMIPGVLVLMAATSAILSLPGLAPWMTEALIWASVIVVYGFLFRYVLAVQYCSIEKFGPFTSLKQSARLTRNYRWGLFALLILATLLCGLLTLAFLIAITIFRLIPIAGIIFSLIAILAMPAYWLAWFSTVLTVAYNRLDLIKNGVPEARLANVFE